MGFGKIENIIVWCAYGKNEIESQDMYSIYTQLLSEHVLKSITDRACDIEYINGIPRVVTNNGMLLLVDELYDNAYKCISEILHLFCADEYKVSQQDRIIIHNNKGDEMCIKWGIFSEGTIFLWVCELGGLQLYQKVDNYLYRFLLLLLIDPLAFISRMRLKISESSVEVQEFFGVLEANINGMLYDHVEKYLLLKQVGYECVVDDIIFLVVDYWVALEILEIEEKLKM